MTPDDLVSIVIPVYNSEKFLQESLESVINQTYKNIEIICVDDGSTDNSPEILKHYSNQITIITQKNGGLASALNTGINSMHGKWFKWFSPDDVMYPDTITVLVREIQNLSENSIVYANWDMINETGKKLRSFTESNYNYLDVFNFNLRLLDGQQINVNTTLIPFSLFSRGIRMDNSIDPVLIDYNFFLLAGLLYQTKFFLIEKPLIKFRIHKNQLSHQNVLQSLENLEKVKNKIISELDTESQKKYIENFIIYTKQNSLSKKFMKTGLKFISTIFPQFLTNNILLFYINKIRRSR